MSPAEQALSNHRPRPEMPRPFDPNSQAAIKFRNDLQKWRDERDDLESAVRREGFALAVLNQEPKCTPRADYHFREPVGRRRKTT